MACLGGTVEGHSASRYADTGPLRWTRYYQDGRVEEGVGRTCKRTAPWATAKTCSYCALFRGIDRYGKAHTGLNVNEEPTVLSDSEREMYEEAENAALDDDNFVPMDRFIRRMNGEVWGMRRLARLGDPDAAEEWAAWMRAYRERHPEYRERQARRRRENRLANAERERVAARLRKRKQREMSRRVSPPIEENRLTETKSETMVPKPPVHEGSRAGARAR